MITWVTAFLDSPANAWDASRDFWTGVTGYGLSAARGPEGQFQTLLPDDGDAYLRVQRLDDGGPRLHLDLHVADVRAGADAAVALGAVEVMVSGHAVMASPGGFPFCFVLDRGESRSPGATQWTAEDGVVHRSRVAQATLDVPAEHWSAEADFWSRLTGWPTTVPEGGGGFALEQPSGRPLRVALRLREDWTGPVRGHVDMVCTDRTAEAARHVALGAVVVGEEPDWTGLLAPDGRRYCLVDAL